MVNGKKKNRTVFSSFIQKGLWTVLAFLFLIFVWWLAASVLANEYLLPNFLQTVKIAVGLLSKAEFWLSFVSTFARAVVAFILSFLTGVLFAVLAYITPAFCRFFSPVVSFLRSLPTMAVLLIILLWSNPNIAPIIVAWLVLFPLIYAEVFSALTQVDKDLIEMSVVYRVPLSRRIWRLYFPTALPSVCETSAKNLSFSLKLIVSAEIMSNTFQSIGGEMQTAVLYDQTALLFALTLFVFGFGYLLECLGVLACRVLFSEGEKS